MTPNLIVSTVGEEEVELKEEDVINPLAPLLLTFKQEFFEVVDEEVDKVDKFFVGMKSELESRWREVDELNK